MAWFATADAFHACGTAPAPMVSGQLHCDGLPNPRGPKGQQHAGSFFMPGNRASQRLRPCCLTRDNAEQGIPELFQNTWKSPGIPCSYVVFDTHTLHSCCKNKSPCLKEKVIAVKRLFHEVIRLFNPAKVI